jgi:hypothetical protein
MDIQFDMFSMFTGGVIGGASTIALKRIIVATAKVIIVVKAFTDLYKFCYDHWKWIRWLFASLLLIIVMITSTGCSSTADSRLSKHGVVIDESRVLKTTYCETELKAYRLVLSSYLSCSSSTGTFLIPNLDGKECSGEKLNVHKRHTVYKSCAIKHKQNRVLTNPFNILRTDL